MTDDDPRVSRNANNDVLSETFDFDLCAPFKNNANSGQHIDTVAMAVL